MGTDEKVANGYLAKGLVGKIPRFRNAIHHESTGVLDNARKQPDIIVEVPGLHPIVIETEFAPRTGEEDALARIDELSASTGKPVLTAIAVQLPPSLKQAPVHALPDAVETADYGVAVVQKGSGGGVERWPEETGDVWNTDLNGLGRAIEACSVAPHQIEQCGSVMETSIKQAANILLQFPEVARKLEGVLHQEAGEQTCRMAAAMILNAMLFHNAVAKHHAVKGVAELPDAASAQYALGQEWKRILSEINFWPIFAVARECLMVIPDAEEVLQRLRQAERKLSSKLGLQTTHHIAGQSFQRLIADRHFLKTYYTRPEGAALLADLALDRLGAKTAEEWAKVEVADPACGTGTLLASAYDRVRFEIGAKGEDPDDRHHELLGKRFAGMDIMPAAVQLAVSQLASTSPAAKFKETRIWRMRYGVEGGKTHIGSLGLMDPNAQEAMDLGEDGTDETAQRLRGEGRESAEKHPGHEALRHNSVDVLLMNPPFTRSTNHEAEARGVPRPAFAAFGTTKAEQERMAKRLADLYRRPSHVRAMGPPCGHGNVGLASYFLDLATQKLKVGGVLACVLPLSFIQGKDWANARRHVERWYKDVCLVSIADATSSGRAFSADTHMAETLLVATRSADRGERKEEALFVNLRRRPAHRLEAIATAQAVRRARKEDAKHGSLNAGALALGNLVKHPLQAGGSPMAVREMEVARFCDELERGEFRLPRMHAAGMLPMTTMGKLGQRGAYHLDLTGNWSRGPWQWEAHRPHCTYPALVAHAAKRERQFVVAPDKCGRIKNEKGAEAKAHEQWDTHAGRLHFNLDFRLNSQSLAACMTQEPSIGGRAWPNYNPKDDGHLWPMLLWWNSTFGLAMFWWRANRQQLGRACIGVATIPDLPVPDWRRMGKAELDNWRAAGEAMQQRMAEGKPPGFQPAHLCADDGMRRETDLLVMKLLGLQGSDEQRDPFAAQWAGEPSVHGGKRREPS